MFNLNKSSKAYSSHNKDTELINGRDVAITISPPLRIGKVEDLYTHDCEEIRKIIRLWGSSFILYPEFAEGRLHYHGVIHQIDYVRIARNRGSINRVGYAVLKNLTPQNWGDVPIITPDHKLCNKISTNRLSWICYCQKSWKFSTRVLPELLNRGPYISGHRVHKTPVIIKTSRGKIVRVTSIATLYRLIEEDQHVLEEPFLLPTEIDKPIGQVPHWFEQDRQGFEVSKTRRVAGCKLPQTDKAAAGGATSEARPFFEGASKPVAES